MFRQIIPTVLALFASLSVSAQTDTAATDSLTSTGDESKLYEWTDPAEGWDGTYHGSEVKTGVYFVLVKARGTDDVIYNIRKDVNLLRGDEQRR